MVIGDDRGMSDGLRLRPVRPSDEDAVRFGQELMVADDFEFALFLADQPFDAWLRQLADQDAGRVPADRVPGSFLLAVGGGAVVGRVSIRYALNESLLSFGGHIGYGVLPAYRRRGHAKEILRQALIIARSRGVDRVLMTCDDDNLGSITTIEGAGGRLDAQWPLADGGDGADGSAPKRRYWIE